MPMFNRKRNQRSRGKPSISWPVESNRPPYAEMATQKPLPQLPKDVEPLESVPSLSSGSASSRASWSLSSAASNTATPRRLSRASTVLFQRHSLSACSDSSCSAFATSMPKHDKPPSQESLEQASKIPIYDADGNSRPFSSIYEGPLAIGEQQLVIFVRHFFCGACQAYLKALSNAVSLKTYFTLPTPTSITIIGLGNPALIPYYRAVTGTPFPIFTDPTRRLHRLLGMGWSLSPGGRPQYFSGVNEVGWVVGQLKQMKNMEEKEIRFKGGSWFWVGGEYLIRDGKIAWCHKMRNYRDHVEMDVIKKLLSVEP